MWSLDVTVNKAIMPSVSGCAVLKNLANTYIVLHHSLTLKQPVVALHRSLAYHQIRAFSVFYLNASSYSTVM